eukprot:6138308-Amphidinium_carterae.1
MEFHTAKSHWRWHGADSSTKVSQLEVASVTYCMLQLYLKRHERTPLRAMKGNLAVTKQSDGSYLLS